MPKFMIVRNVGRLTQAQIDEAAQRALDALAQFPQVKWVRTYYAAEEGKMYCEYEAPTIDLIYQHSRLAHAPADSVTIVSELLPSMFR